MNNHALVDAEAVIVPLVFKYEESQNWMGAITEAESKLLAYLEGAGCQTFTMYFSGITNWRKRVFPGYKSNRPPKSDTFIQLMAKVSQYFKEKYDWVCVESLEADDVIGYVATTPQNVTHDIIVSFDKDFYQVPATFMRVGTKNSNDEAPVTTNLVDADYMFHLQWLMGDPTDGYAGVKGIGEKKADKILGNVDPEGRETAILNAYLEAAAKNKQTERDAVVDFLLNCWMCRILRHGEIEFVAGDEENTGTVDIKLYKPNVDADLLKTTLAKIKGKGSKMIKDAMKTGIMASAWKVA